jgi:hypothetical protein
MVVEHGVDGRRSRPARDLDAAEHEATAQESEEKRLGVAVDS